MRLSPYWLRTNPADDLFRFPGRPLRCSPHHRPRSSESNGSSSQGLRPAYRVWRHQPAAVLSDTGSFHEVLLPLRAVNVPGPLIATDANRCHVPPSGFLNLSAGYSPKRLAGLFRPADTYRLFPFRVFPSQGAAPPLDGRCPHDVSRRCASNRSQRPIISPSPGPCSPSESVAHQPGITLGQWPDTLLGFPLYRVLPLPVVDPASRILPSRAFSSPVRDGTRLPLRVLPNREPGWSLARLPTLLRFATSSNHSLVQVFAGPGLSFRLGVDPSSPWDPRSSLVRCSNPTGAK
jgi:hypothetical protein